MRDNAMAAKAASRMLATLPIDMRNSALAGIKSALQENRDAIFAANKLDIADAKGGDIAQPLIKRLLFDGAKLEETISGLNSLIALDDPLGKVTIKRELAPGMVLERVSCPIGVIGVIFESRPDALIQIAALCLKSGNASLLKGGSEAMRTNKILFDIMNAAALAAGIPEGWAQLMHTRAAVTQLLEQDEYVDLIIPRGSNEFVRYIMDNTRIPVMGHADGLCHVYVDFRADLRTALRVALDSKAQYPAVCNAAETLLVHNMVADAFIPAFHHLVRKHGIVLLGDEYTRRLIDCPPADNYDTEYLDKVMAVKVVYSVEEAITHINEHGSHHTDSIVTQDDIAAAKFLTGVDSAGVYRNCSTRFADGFRYGFGAEVGVSTGKLHSRGPVGLDGMTTYKYIINGSGDIVADFADGNRTFTHKDL